MKSPFLFLALDLPPTPIFQDINERSEWSCQADQQAFRKLTTYNTVRLRNYSSSASESDLGQIRRANDSRVGINLEETSLDKVSLLDSQRAPGRY